MSDNQSADPLYRDGRHYDLKNAGLTNDIPFYVEMARQSAGPVLELGCGTGRITMPIALSGIPVTGIDLSDGMLSEARRKSDGQDLPVEWINADIKTFQLGKHFPLIFFPFNSIAHFHDHADLEALFANVSRHLAPKGRFVFDIFNPDVNYLVANAPPRQVAEYRDPDSGEQVLIHETQQYDAASQVNHILWHYIVGENRYSCALNMRIFFPLELDLLVRHHGFEIIEKFGDFDGSPFDSASLKQIMVCRAGR